MLSWEGRVLGHQTSMVSSTASPGRETKELTVSLEKHQGMTLPGDEKRITLAPWFYQFCFLAESPTVAKREPNCEPPFLLGF